MESKDTSQRTMRIQMITDVSEKMLERKKNRPVIITPADKHSLKKIFTEDSKDARYRELLQSVYDAVLICDLDGGIVDVNERAIVFLLYSRDKLCSLTVFDIIYGADKSLVKTLLENLENERFTLIQAYCVREDGSFFPAEIAVNKLKLEKLHLCFFLRDITIRRQAEEKLRIEHNAIQNAGNGIAIADLEATLEYVNPAVAQMWGYDKPDQLVGQDARKLLNNSAAANEMMAAVTGAKQIWVDEMKVTRQDGSEFDVQISAACNRNSDGDPTGIVFSFIDISDRKRAEEAVRESERKRVMLESLGAACHHLSQPATVLLANLGMMQKKLDTSDEMTGQLLQTSIHAADMLGEILHKLNAVEKYKTTQYLKKSGGPDSEESRILDIEDNGVEPNPNT